MDYWDLVQLTHHKHWEDFRANTTSLRTVLLDVHAPTPYHSFTFDENDIIVVGRESDGFPHDIVSGSPHRITIPMRAVARSLNVATALSMALGEALRQTRWCPLQG